MRFDRSLAGRLAEQGEQMARYKNYSYEQGEMIPISFREQVLPGTFEYTLSYLIDHELDLSAFDERYSNDDTGRPAYDPALLLKIVLYAYARGIVSSRQIERCCRENVISGTVLRVLTQSGRKMGTKTGTILHRS
jgi:transposase